ncbi:MAG: DedA family protein [Bacteroidia bacterium]|jgi:membrane-associated protein|nr:DedA family protein [Bacteroidia bacterium]
MELIDFILHIDRHLETFIANYGTLVYLLLFLIVFCETGLVVTPFLPGDSLLFAAGALAANPANNLNVGLIIVLLIVAALIGDNTNYFIGRYLAKKGEGAKLFGIFTIRKDYLDKTHAFYEKNGPRTIIIARFVPIVRTFAPFVAGVGSMTYKRYITYCVAGAILWVTLLTLVGYGFGNIPWVKANFELVVFGIIGISLLPIVFEFVKTKLGKR